MLANEDAENIGKLDDDDRSCLEFKSYFFRTWAARKVKSTSKVNINSIYLYFLCAPSMVLIISFISILLTELHTRRVK